MKTHNSFLLNTVTNGSPACSRKKTCYKNQSFKSKIRTEIKALGWNHRWIYDAQIS